MRNATTPLDCRPVPVKTLLRGSALIVATSILLCACAAQKDGELNAGREAFESRQYDAVVSHADAYLAAHPNGGGANGAAEANYLKGRAIESRLNADPKQARDNLQAARTAYIAALDANPTPQLEGYIRASLGNVCYWQDDYGQAVNQWTNAYEKLDTAEAKSFTLYRVGQAQQRQGQFDLADKTFASVVAQYPDTEAAMLSRGKQGVRGFTVQLATFMNAKSADAAIAELQKGGVKPTRTINAKGYSVVGVGPIPSYPQAQQLKQKFAGQYPDALIVP